MLFRLYTSVINNYEHYFGIIKILEKVSHLGHPIIHFLVALNVLSWNPSTVS